MNPEKFEITLKRVVLVLLSVAVGSGVVLDTNPYFDRILSSFGQEVIFYGLGVNFSRIQINTQTLVQQLCECKMIFRMDPSCLTAFAEKLDNDTILCTWFQQPIYQLPTIRKEKGKAFAFYKEKEQVGSWFNTWGILQNNGIFYVYEKYQPNSLSYQICYNGSYPNGYVLRLKTQEDLDRFWKEMVYSYFKDQAPNFAIDMIPGDDIMNPVWRDGTLLKQTVVAGFINELGTGYESCIFITFNATSNLTYLRRNCGSLLIFCEVNLFP